jgi:hypothetical protein
MAAMENLLNGVPQTVSTADAFLGLFAWHILPDVLVFQPEITELRHNDPLVESGGVLSLGLRPHVADNDREGIRWSLSLAHLGFYGPPVQASRTLGTQTDRVTFDQFVFVAPGSLSVSLQCSLVDMAGYISTLWTFIVDNATQT